jgi:hypothetical protein
MSRRQPLVIVAPGGGVPAAETTAGLVLEAGR